MRVSEETYARLQKLADGRPLGMVVERALDRLEAGTAVSIVGPVKVTNTEIGPHPFTPVKGNALRCVHCATRRKDHK